MTALSAGPGTWLELQLAAVLHLPPSVLVHDMVAAAAVISWAAHVTPRRHISPRPRTRFGRLCRILSVVRGSWISAAAVLFDVAVITGSSFYPLQTEIGGAITENF